MLEIERRVIEGIDFEGLLLQLAELTRIRSLVGRENEAQEHVSRLLSEIGLEVDKWELDFDELRRHPAFAWEIERDRGLGVVGILEGDSEGPILSLNGHVDVVPAGDRKSWRYPPWEATTVGDRIFGRGVLDMKGGLCCAIYAAKALLEAGVKIRGRLLVQSVIGEEDGGVGTLATILRGYSGDAVIIVEPTDLAVVPAQAGALNFRLRLAGKAAHACMRADGISSIQKFFLVYEALDRLEKTRNSRPIPELLRGYEVPYPLSIGTISAGNWASTVPDQLVCEGRYGVALGEELESARSEFEEAVRVAAESDEWLSENLPEVEWWGGQYAPAEVPLDSSLIGALQGCFWRVNGRPPTVKGVTYGSDMRLFVNQAKVPAVLFGPGDVRLAHGPDESVAIEDLLNTTQVLALTALHFCGWSE
jgi:acetylornithine deacetylase